MVTTAGMDAVRERIAAHSWSHGGVEGVRVNRGHTLYSQRTGAQSRACDPPARATTCKSYGGDVMPGAHPVTSAP